VTLIGGCRSLQLAVSVRTRVRLSGPPGPLREFGRSQPEIFSPFHDSADLRTDIETAWARSSAREFGEKRRPLRRGVEASAQDTGTDRVEALVIDTIHTFPRTGSAECGYPVSAALDRSLKRW